MLEAFLHHMYNSFLLATEEDYEKQPTYFYFSNQLLHKNINCLKFWVLSAVKEVFEQYNQHTLALTLQAEWITFFLVML